MAALVFTAALTLAVAAAAILPRLERRLRHEEVRSLRDTAVAARPSFADLSAASIRAGAPPLAQLAHSLDRRTGARVRFFDASGTVLADTRPAEGPEPAEISAKEPRAKIRKGIPDTADEAVATVPVRDSGAVFHLQLTKPLDDVAAAASDVRHAFTWAALVGLVAAFLVGFPLATRLLRRLRRLRSGALEVADSGLDIELPQDRSRDEVGDLTRAFGTMQERLRKQEAVRRSFLATASHELRTPLASLEAMLELLDADLAAAPPDVDDARVRAAAAHAQSRRLAALAAGLLDLTRLDAGGDIRSEPVELGELSRAVAAEFEARGEIRLSDAGEPGVWAMADPGAVARVLRILVDNAIRYAGTPVEVAVHGGDGHASISVRDAGPGVPSDEREVVFERFRRGRSATNEGGFGLGLAIARELAQRMSGELTLEDADPGARFTLVLAAAAPELVAADPELSSAR